MHTLDDLSNEDARRAAFPVVAQQAYFGHAGVAPMCGAAARAMNAFNAAASAGCQENEATWQQVALARSAAADLLGCEASAVSLIGPTSLGLNLVAKGLAWNPGDEVVFHARDYPANVYPWRELARQGVTPVAIEPDTPGAITWELVEAALTDRTRLVALASCHYLTGYRIDIDGIGRELRARGILFCLDAIQTLGAFDTPMTHVDFLSADAHKWMIGPAGAGVFVVHPDARDHLRPALLGSWNVVSPEFVAQDTIAFEAGGRRYEPGMLNLPGICGMAAGLDLLRQVGIPAIEARLMHLRGVLVDGLAARGFVEANPAIPRAAQCAIVTVAHPSRETAALAAALKEAGVFVSPRQDHTGKQYLRFSPHFYNTEDEIDRAFAALDRA